MKRLLPAAAAAALGWAPVASARAQLKTPEAVPLSAGRSHGVRASATVEVLDDAAQIDEVISRLQRAPTPPVGDKADPAVERANKAEVGRDDRNAVLKAERPNLADAPLDKDGRGDHRLSREERRERRRGQKAHKAQ